MTKTITATHLLPGMILVFSASEIEIASVEKRSRSMMKITYVNGGITYPSPNAKMKIKA